MYHSVDIAILDIIEDILIITTYALMKKESIANNKYTPK